MSKKMCVHTITGIMLLLISVIATADTTPPRVGIPKIIEVGNAYELTFFLEGKRLVEITAVDPTGWLLIQSNDKTLDGRWISIVSVYAIRPSQTSVAQEKAAKIFKKNQDILRSALQTYHLRMGYYPSSADGLDALLKTSKQKRAPLHALPTDAWGRAFHYESDGKTFTVVSYGADGQKGGQGDDADVIVLESHR